MLNIEDLVTEVLTEHLEDEGQEGVKVTLPMHLVRDLGLGSLTLAAVVARLEFECDLEPFANGHTPDEVNTVADLVRIFSA